MAKFSLRVLVFILSACYTKALPTGRVVGGEDAREGQFRHQVSLRKDGSHTCGGSIISEHFILTAAHCVGYVNDNGFYVSYTPSVFTVRAGSTDRFQGGVLLKVAEVIVHENYGNFLNDVALLRLEKPIIFSKHIQPIPLASSNTPSGSNVTISGWGRIKHGGDIPRKLQWNILTAISREECKEAINFNTESIICFAHASGNGACNGDSGGPAIYNGEVVGIAGFVVGGCGTSNPDGYAKVYYHLDWIKKHSNMS